MLSSFGCMFAPRHALAAAELARVLRPQGRLGICAFTPDGAGGDFFRTLGALAPPPPAFAENPLDWGEPVARARRCSATSTCASSGGPYCERFASLDAAVERYTTTFGPVVALGGPALADDLRALFERHAIDGGTAIPYDYLVTLSVAT